MDRGLAVLLTAAAGGLIALQAPINAGLGKATGGLPAVLVSFAVDRLGLFGLDQVPISLERVAGIALLGAGTFLVLR